jgi:hypothetical protein
VLTPPANVAKAKIATLSANGNVRPPSVTKSVNPSVNNPDAPPVAKNWAAVNVPSNATNQNVKYVAPSNIVKKVPAQNAIPSVKNQPATPNAPTQHLPVNPFVKNRCAIGNAIAQQIVKNQNAPLSAKNHRTANHKHPPRIAANRKNQKPNVVNVTKPPVPVAPKAMLLLLDAKRWNCNAPATAPPKPMLKKPLAKQPALNLHRFANNVVRLYRRWCFIDTTHLDLKVVVCGSRSFLSNYFVRKEQKKKQKNVP